MDPILDAIDEALKRRGLSDAAASKLAVGNYSLLKNMRAARGDEKRYSFQSLAKLADVLGLECYFGPPRDVGPVERVAVEGADYAHVPLHNAMLAAGAGAENGSEEIVDHLAFRRDWLTRIGVSASSARLARVWGDSMQPSLWAGDMILINTSSREPPLRRRDARDQRRSPIYALIDNGEARVKRIERPTEDQMLLISDSPDYAPELRRGSDEAITIVGKVVWWGHTAKE
ncbi:MAG: helix-turn-helix transcriptional regulator [Pseudodonghicola sp.]